MELKPLSGCRGEDVDIREQYGHFTKLAKLDMDL